MRTLPVPKWYEILVPLGVNILRCYRSKCILDVMELKLALPSMLCSLIKFPPRPLSLSLSCLHQLLSFAAGPALVQAQDPIFSGAQMIKKALNMIF